jgi:serine beta-lactamase-like protein LACTB
VIRRALLLGILLLRAGAAHAQPPGALPGPPAPPGTTVRRLPPAAADAVDAMIGAQMAQLSIPGLSVAIASDAGLMWSAGYGTADLENDVPARAGTVYRLASISKTVTAAAVMQLVERGTIQLDRPVQTYVPAFPQNGPHITVAHLLAHQSGIRDYRPGEFASTRHYGSVAESLAIFARDPLVFAPGTGFLYSTWGYGVLGAAIEGASGTSYLDYVKRNIALPAGITTLRDDSVYALIPGRARGYFRTGGSWQNSALADTSDKIPGGGLCATAEDVARFGAALTDGTLVSAATLARMTTEQRTRDGKPTTSGLGVFLSEKKGVREAWHTGGQQQVSTVLYMRPARHTTVVLLANVEGVREALLDLARRLADTIPAP